MQRPLDPLRFKENVYERPNQDWICGHAAEGHACPLGPDARGNCRHTGECLPARKEDRWGCTRAEAHGGKCSEGPLPDGKCAHPIPPCQPVRSLRRSRALVVWLTIALTSGGLLILFGQYFRHAWVDPGDLTNAHAPSATKCSDCHSNDSASAGRLVSNSLGRRAQADSALCLKCHELGEQPLHPHGLEPKALAKIQNNFSAGALPRKPALLRVSHAFTAHDAKSGDLACATCHQEHHGRNFDLTHLSNAQCQTCHAVQFASFQKGHPEFAGYPYQRRTRIFFDHASHLQQHFAERKDKAPTGCQSCHVPGPAGRFMQVKNFNAACASCHSAQIKGEGMTVKGVAFFTIPGIDTDTLASKSLSIGEWPKFADGKLTPFMELLLNREPTARAALEKLRGVDLLDLTKATPDQLAAAEQFAWSVKSLLYHLVLEGHPFLMKEMKDAIEPAGLEVPRSALIAAQIEWMPHLLAEVGNFEKGIKPALPEKPKPSPTAPAASPNEKSDTSDESLLGGEADLLAEPAAPSNATPGDDLLAGGDDLTTATASPTPSDESGDLLGGDLLSAEPTAVATPSATPAPTPVAMPAEEWVAAGGWYRPQSGFTLFYRPVGHADPFLVAWLNASAGLQSDNPTAATRTAFQSLADPQGPGLCMKCHTAETSGRVTKVNWNPAQPNVQSRPFTTFNHTTHFSLVGDAGCQTCHVFNPKAQYAKYFARDSGAEMAPTEPVKFESNFAPMSKMLCAQCHQSRIAGNGCVLCHRYHAAPSRGTLAEIGRFQTSDAKARGDEVGSKAVQ